MKTQVEIPESETLDSRQQGVSRRDFLKVGVSSFLGLIAMQHLQSSAWTQLGGIAARAKHCIVLFMNGGASQLDTFDPCTAIGNLDHCLNQDYDTITLRLKGAIRWQNGEDSPLSLRQK